MPKCSACFWDNGPSDLGCKAYIDKQDSIINPKTGFCQGFILKKEGSRSPELRKLAKEPYYKRRVGK